MILLHTFDIQIVRTFGSVMLKTALELSIIFWTVKYHHSVEQIRKFKSTVILFPG